MEKTNFIFIKRIALFISLTIVPILLGMWLLRLWHWDFSIPLAYGNPGADEVWQLVATKTLLDTGWILENPYMGAPDVSTWYANSASQISVTHQLLMRGIGSIVENSVKVQQYYFVSCFSLITITTYILAKVLNINTILAIVVGLIYATTSYRMNSLFFAYLANYWIIPLSLIPVYWLLEGRYSCSAESKISRGKVLYYYGVGVLVSSLIAITDGYYAFFYLLLIAFSIFNLIVNENGIKTQSHRAALIFILITIATSLLVAIPLKNHRVKFKHEANQDQMKAVSDAEVYVPTLKLLITPIHDHRIPVMNKIGDKLIETANFNRKFPYSIGAPVVLGTVGSFLLIAALIRLLINREEIRKKNHRKDTLNYERTILSSSKLSAFILLCSISGGIGSLIALGFPAIRAYERFPIFLILVLYIGAAAYASSLVTNLKLPGRFAVLLVSAIIGIVAILDQTRSDPLSLENPDAFKSRTQRFLAERNMIKRIEEEFASPIMVYQYPYSQYLTNNKYFGWGQFGHIRQYLHSSNIRWSNGAAKDSYIDVWHEKRSSLSMDILIAEMQSVGFDGFMVDRLVLSDSDYEKAKDSISKILHQNPLEDKNARMTFWRMPRSHISIKYDEKYQNAISVTINDAMDFNGIILPRIINRNELEKHLLDIKPIFPITISAKDYPDIFYKAIDVEMGMGFEMLENKYIKGGPSCKSSKGIQRYDLNSKIDLYLTNETDFDWSLNSGPRPIRVGVMVRDDQNKFLFDSILKTDNYLKSRETLETSFKVNDIFRANNVNLPEVVKVTIKMMQDGNRWFDGNAIKECSFAVHTR